VFFFFASEGRGEPRKKKENKQPWGAFTLRGMLYAVKHIPTKQKQIASHKRGGRSRTISGEILKHGQTQGKTLSGGTKGPGAGSGTNPPRGGGRGGELLKTGIVRFEARVKGSIRICSKMTQKA